MTMKFLKQDLGASLVVFLVALPLCLGIAIASGVPPAAGLLTGIIGGIVVGGLAGCPLQVSGPAAGLVVIVWEIVEKHGIEGLAAAVILAGLLQIAGGFARIGRWFQAVSPAVVQGMLTSIGILIVLGQIHVMLDVKPQGGGLANIRSLFELVVSGKTATGATPSITAAMFGIGSVMILSFWSKIAPAWLRNVPAPLLAVCGLTAIAAALSSEVLRVNVPSSLTDSFNFSGISNLFQGGISSAIIISGITIALVASAESLLSSGAVKRIKPGAKADYDRELIAQGAGNLLCGLIGGLPLTGVIVRSTANISAGAQTRASAIFHGVWILGFVALVPNLLNQIPIAVLAGVLVFFGFKLLNVKAMKEFAQQSRAELFLFLATVIGIVTTDLLMGVLLGFGLSLLRLTFGVSRLETDLQERQAQTYLTLKGVASFLSLPKLVEVFEEIPAKGEITINTEKLHMIDHACLDFIKEWKTGYERAGGKVSYLGPCPSSLLLHQRQPCPTDDGQLKAKIV